jgi:hypothetical protein
MTSGAGMSSEEFVEAWTTKAAKNRLKGLNWDELHLNTLLVDPPRVCISWVTCRARQISIYMHISMYSNHSKKNAYVLDFDGSVCL